jgi:hypothetical protein
MLLVAFTGDLPRALYVSSRMNNMKTSGSPPVTCIDGGISKPISHGRLRTHAYDEVNVEEPLFNFEKVRERESAGVLLAF